MTGKGRLDYSYVHRMTGGDVSSVSGFQAALESFTPIDAQNSAIDVADMRVRILRPPGSARYEVLTGLAIVEGFLGFIDKSAGSYNIKARVVQSTIVRHIVSGAGDASAGQTLISRLPEAYRLRPDQATMVWWKVSNVAVEYGTNALSFASAPVAPTDPPYGNKSIELNRRAATTTIGAIAYELRSTFGRVFFGDPATEK